MKKRLLLLLAGASILSGCVAYDGYGQYADDYYPSSRVDRGYYYNNSNYDNDSGYWERQRYRQRLERQRELTEQARRDSNRSRNEAVLERQRSYDQDNRSDMRSSNRGGGYVSPFRKRKYED